MKIRAAAAGVLLPILFLIGILITTVTGYWKTQGSKVPVRYAAGEYAGEYNPGDIRGSYSLGDVEQAFGIPVSILAEAFGLDDTPNPGAVQIKTFEELYGEVNGMEIGTDSMRLFVALYKGLPYESGEDTALPESAWKVLAREGAADGDTLNVHSTRIVSPQVSAGEAQTIVHTQDTGERLVRGKTLFSELLDWGIKPTEIITILGVPMGPAGMTVRDYCREQGVEFSGVKSSLQDLADSLE